MSDEPVSQERGRGTVMPGLSLRIVRGGLLATCCTALAVLGHVVGGGGVPSLSALLAITVLAACGFSVLTGGRRPVHRLAAGVLAVQAAFHGAFSLTAAEGQHLHGGAATAATPRGGLVPDLLGTPGVPMLVGHVLAAVGLAALVSYGDALARALLQLLGVIRLPELDLPAVPDLPRWAPVATALPLLGRRLAAQVHPRRGPPPLWAA